MKLIALVAFPVNGPTKPVELIVPAENPPLPSRRTMVLGFERAVEALARVDPDATLEALEPPTMATTVEDWVPVTSPFKGPKKLVAEVAFPKKAFAVTLLAEKLEEGSLLTIALATEFEVDITAKVEPIATVPADAPPT